MTAVIFDCDGTLVNTEPVARAAWQDTLARYGYLPTDDDAQAAVGLPYARVYESYARRVDLPPADEFRRHLAEALLTRFEAGLRPFDDAVEAVEALQAAEIAVAIASSSERQRRNHTLSTAGLQDLFAVTVAGDEVPRGKPAPDIFLTAADCLGVEPLDCVVVEDSPPGVAAGRAAGMTTIAICRVPGIEASLAAADRVLHRLTAAEILRSAPRL